MKQKVLSSRQVSGRKYDVYYPLTASTDPISNRKFSTDEVIDLLSVIQELEGLEISVRAEGNYIVFTVGDAEYQVPATTASKIF